MGRPSSQVVGRRWFWGQHLVLCHGPIDAIRKIWFGEKIGFASVIQTNQRIRIDQPYLFGDRDTYGGVVGNIDVLLGTPNQPVNDYLAEHCGSEVNGQRVCSAFRYLSSLVFRKTEMGNSSYPPAVSVEVERIRTGWNGQPIWYIAKAQIGNGGMNPAHMLRELIECPEWGTGNSNIDDAAFQRCADALFAENFGLHAFWTKQQPVEDFVKDICRHINGYVFTDESSGKITMRLARDDYQPDNLPILDSQHIRTVRNVSRRTQADVVNTLTVNYTHPDTYDKAAVTVINSAMVHATGRSVGESINMPMIHDGQLAQRVGMRELKVLSAQLLTAEIYCDTTAAKLQPGDVIRVVFPPAGLNHIMRVQSKRRGGMSKPEIKLDVMQDIFTAATGNYAPPPPTDWDNPISAPQPIAVQSLIELPFWALANSMDVATLAALPDYVGYIAWLGKKPSGDTLGADLYLNNAATWRFIERAGFATVTSLSAPLDKSSTSAQLNQSSVIASSLPALALIDDELVAITHINGDIVTLIRSVLDSEPASHIANAPIILINGYAIREQFVLGESVQARALTITPKGRLEENQATTLMTTLKGRAHLPLPPCNVKLNGQLWPVSLTLPVNITWSHRNRLSQTASPDKLQSWFATGAPEQGTNTEVQIINADTGQQIHSQELTTTSFEITDVLAPQSITNIKIKLTTKRDGKACLNSFEWVFKRDLTPQV
ncbi:hypothetical protein EFU26_07170 [Vibrio cholerae]|nr:hypothetical protein [Vibrio cholerae]